MASKVSLVDYTHDDAVVASVTGSPEGDSSRNEGVWDKLYYNNTGSSIPAGDAVELDLTASGLDAGGNSIVGRGISNTDTVADNPLTVGAASEAIAASTWGRVRIWGAIDNVKVAGSTAAGVNLQMSATAATLEAAGATTGRRMGVSLTAESGGTATVFMRATS